MYLVNSYFCFSNLNLPLYSALMYATIFGYVASIIHRISQQTSELNERQTELVDFIDVHKFPDSLASRMEDFFYNHWFTTKGVVASDVSYCVVLLSFQTAIFHFKPFEI